MKTLYMIGGTMGVGKTTVCKELNHSLHNSVFLDGDWCWDAHPFVVNEETKAMVIENICYLLNNFIHCHSYENIVFCWVMHEQSIIDSLLDRLDLKDCHVKSISLIANEQALSKRLKKDIENGKRQQDIIKKSLERIALYQNLNTIKIDTSDKTIYQIVEEIKKNRL